MKEQARTANDARDEVHQTEGNSLKRKSFTAAQLRMNGVAENTDDTDGESTEVEAHATDDEFRPSVEQPEFVVPNPEDFPSMPVRTGRGSLSELLMRVFVKLLAKCTVSVENLRTIFVDIANDVFGQHWTLKSTFASPSVTQGKKRRVAIDLTHRFPGNQAVASWMKAAHVMSLHRLALRLTNRKEGTVATLGGDATTKAVGHKLYDVHTMSLILTPPDGKKEVFTTGFQENAGHKGEDQAKVMKTSLECLGILCGMPVDEVMEIIDFFMGDRAQDVEVALDKLGIPENKRLKCTPHVLLCIDECIDKVFRQHESSIGFSELLTVPSSRFNVASKSTSILTLALIAFSKLLSPSHAANSVSLYKEFCVFLEDEKNGFKGFVGNRFGLRADLSCEFLHRCSPTPPPPPSPHYPLPFSSLSTCTHTHTHTRPTRQPFYTSSHTPSFAHTHGTFSGMMPSWPFSRTKWTTMQTC